MKFEVKVPEVGESVTEGLLVEWSRVEGDQVSVDDELFVLETDKITMNVNCEQSGVLNIIVPAGETVTVGQVVAVIEAATDGPPGSSGDEVTDEAGPAEAQPAPVSGAALPQPETAPSGEPVLDGLPPSVQRLVQEHHLDPGQIPGTGKGNRITKEDVLQHLAQLQSKTGETGAQDSTGEPPLIPVEPEEATASLDTQAPEELTEFEETNRPAHAEAQIEQSSPADDLPTDETADESTAAATVPSEPPLIPFEPVAPEPSPETESPEEPIVAEEAGPLTESPEPLEEQATVEEVLPEVLVDQAESVEEAPEPEPDQPVAEFPAVDQEESPRQSREKMSPLRQRLAERLVQIQGEAAILTTFNEVDMSRVQALRASLRPVVQERYGVDLGLMSFFVRASVEALKSLPRVNAFIDGDQVVTNHYFDIGIAISTEKGLVVPALRNADQLSLVEIERDLGDLAGRARERKLELSDLSGAVFTISNGGVFGSLMSTPILNPPQSAILGMHTIKKRPVVVDDQIVIRPMMYLALSYDHRLVDGSEAVTFLKRIVECIENPEPMLLEV